MRGNRWIPASCAIAVPACVWALVSCIDLFHDTSMSPSCDEDACAPPTAAGFCAWTTEVAHAKAAHACAWLGACETPLGDNAFGQCMVHALSVYDCSLNPNRKVIGATEKYWECLANAATCDAVSSCVYPSGVQVCGAADFTTTGFTTCGTESDTRRNGQDRISCEASDAAARGENCIASGRTCTQTSIKPTVGECTGAGAAHCQKGGCFGTSIYECTDGGIDRGVDCANFGAGRCVTSDGGVSGCLATGDEVCAPSIGLQCDDAGVASGCPSGVLERIDCAKMLGGRSCDPSAPGPSWDVSRACVKSGATCGEDQCEGNGDVVASCARGEIFRVSCGAAGLGSCHLRQGLAMGASCTRLP